MVICSIGFRVFLDPDPLTMSEQLEVLGKVNTFVVARSHDGFEVDYRSLNYIIWTKGEGIILAEHQCGRKPIAQTLPDYFPKPLVQSTEECPF